MFGGLNTLVFTLDNPIRYRDTTGQFVQVVPMMILRCFANVVCREAARRTGQAVVDAAVVALGGLILQDQIEDQTLDDMLRDNTHTAYKEAYYEPPPPDMDPCEKIRWQIRREQALMDGRLAWDSRWGPGTHKIAIQRGKAAINSLRQKYRNIGCIEECP